MRAPLVLVVVPIVALACGAASPPERTSTLSVRQATLRAPRTGASCAGDAAWVQQVGGERPRRSTLVRVDVLQRRGGFGPDGPIETFNELGGVRRSSEEKYQWTTKDGSGSQLVVVRNASGPIPRSYDAPISHASGVKEYPLVKPKFAFFQPTHVLFVFPDGTWVRTEGDKVARVRATYAATGKPPPPPAADADVGYEACGDIDANEIELPFDVWSIAGDRVAARLFGSRQEGELVYGFAAPDAAARAAREQAAVCAKKPCPWATAASVEGALVRYDVVVRQAPTSRRIELKIAHETPPLTAPPPPNAPVAPGTPPSGAYQRFVDIRSDTCRTRSAGQPFPSVMTPIMIAHRDGKARTTLQSVEPRARGILTSSPMNDVELVAGSVATKEIKHLCPDYTIARKLTVLAATGDTIRLRDEVRYVGSTAGCRHPNLPSDCGHEAITTLVLARRSCEARCDGTLVGRVPVIIGEEAAPRLDVSCSCP